MSDRSFMDALTWLLPLIGSGGITAIAVAWLGSKRPPGAVAVPQHPTSALAAGFGAAGIGALLADHYSIDRLTNELRRLADANEALAKGVSRYCDLNDITQALERIHRDREAR